MVRINRCKDCKHCYSYFKQIKKEDGTFDVVIIPKCRLENRILEDGTPAKLDCFEPRESIKI